MTQLVAFNTRDLRHECLIYKSQLAYDINLNEILKVGIWIAKWYYTWLWTSVSYTAPWVMSSCLVVDKLFIGPKHNIYTFSWFYLVALIWYYYLSVNFVMWIVQQKIENKWNIFSKNSFLKESNAANAMARRAVHGDCCINWTRDLYCAHDAPSLVINGRRISEASIRHRGPRPETPLTEKGGRTKTTPFT